MDVLAECDEKIARLRQQLGAGDGGELARELARAHAEKAELVHGFGHLAAAAGEYERAIAL